LAHPPALDDFQLPDMDQKTMPAAFNSPPPRSPSEAEDIKTFELLDHSLQPGKIRIENPLLGCSRSLQ
jgi:hypothetical protein